YTVSYPSIHRGFGRAAGQLRPAETRQCSGTPQIGQDFPSYPAMSGYERSAVGFETLQQHLVCLNWKPDHQQEGPRVEVFAEGDAVKAEECVANQVFLRGEASGCASDSARGSWRMAPGVSAEKQANPKRSSGWWCTVIPGCWLLSPPSGACMADKSEPLSGTYNNPEERL
ncbi:hypothetical protein KUCAC02_019220, partial [Chaenocephalus aceratus]